MKGWRTSGRHRKDLYREVLASVGPKNGVILNPGPDMQDVDLLIKHSVIHDGTNHVLLVERDADSYKEIDDKIKLSWPFSRKPVIAKTNYAELDELDFGPDLWFMDLFGNLTRGDVYLLSKEAKKFTQATDFFLTICLAPNRHNHFFERLVDSFKKLENRKFYGNFIRFGSHFKDEWRESLSTYYILFEDVLFGDGIEVVTLEPYRDEKSTALMCMMWVHGFGQSIPMSNLEYILPPILPKENYKPRQHKEELPADSVIYIGITKLFLNARSEKEQLFARQTLNAYMCARKQQGFNPNQVRAGVRAAITRAGGNPGLAY